MTTQVLEALWNKILNVFVTKSDLLELVEDKQDKLVAGNGILIRNNVISNTVIPDTEKEEIVHIAISSENSSIIEGLTLNIFYNDEILPSETIITDENGMCVFKVPYGYKYKVVFPSIEGYESIGNEIHTASVIERSIEKEYKAIVIPSDEDLTNEKVIVWLHYYTGLNSASALSNIDIEITINNITTTYTTNSSGVVTFYVPIGEVYTITVPILESYYIYNLIFSKTFLAEKEVNVTYFTYFRYNSGLFAIDKDGIYELRFNELEAAINAGILSEEDIKYIEYKTATSILYNASFLMEIDDIADHSHNLKTPTSYLWGHRTTPPNSPVVCISDLGSAGVTVANYGELYYNGYLVNNLLLKAGDEQGIATPLIDTYLSMHPQLGYSTLTAFLPTRWQHIVIMESSYRELPHIIKLVRPEALYTHLRTITGSGTGLDWYYTSTIYRNDSTVLHQATSYEGGSAGGFYTNSVSTSFQYSSGYSKHMIYQYPCYNLEPDINLEVTTPHYIVSNGIKVLCNEDGNIATLFDVDEENNVTWKAITWDSNGLNVITLNDLNWQDILDLIETNGKCYFLSGGSNKFLIGEDEYTWDEINNTWDSTITEFTANTLYRRLETDTWILCDSNGEEIITEDTDTGDIYYYTCDNDLISNLLRWDKTLLSTTLPSGTSGVSVPDGIVSGKITISGTDYQVDSPRRNAIYTNL